MSLQHTLNQAINSRGVTAEIYYDTGPEVRIEITGNAGYGAQAGWRVRGRASDGDNTYYVEGDQYTTSGSFEAIDGKTYMFQAVWGSASDGVDFTVNFDSNNEEEDSGGGNGDSADIHIVILYDGGYSWDYFPEEYVLNKYPNTDLILPQPYKNQTLLSTNEFIITGNANGGIKNTSLIASLNTWENYNFTGWTDQHGRHWTDRYTVFEYGELNAGQSKTQTTDYSNNTLQSLPKPLKEDSVEIYNVIYNSNGGLSSKVSETVTKTETYEFDYWCSNSSGTGIQYSDSSSFTESTEVYAIWKTIAGNNPTVTMPTVTKEGYKFKGWTISDQAILIPAGSIVEITKNTEFYAVWESNGKIFIHNGTKWIPVV